MASKSTPRDKRNKELLSFVSGAKEVVETDNWKFGLFVFILHNCKFPVGSK